MDWQAVKWRKISITLKGFERCGLVIRVTTGLPVIQEQWPRFATTVKTVES